MDRLVLVDRQLAVALLDDASVRYQPMRADALDEEDDAPFEPEQQPQHVEPAVEAAYFHFGQACTVFA